MSASHQNGLELEKLCDQLLDKTKGLWKHLGRSEKRRDKQAYFAILRNEQTIYDWRRAAAADETWMPPPKGRAAKRDRLRSSIRQNPRDAAQPSAGPRVCYEGANPLPGPIATNTEPEGRAWTSPAYVEIDLGSRGMRRNAALQYLKRFVTSDCDVIFRDWARHTFGSVDDALAQLRTLCQLVEPWDANRKTDWNEQQKRRLQNAAMAWTDRLSVLEQKHFLGREGTDHIKELIKRIEDLSRKVPSSDEAKKEWHNELQAIIVPKGQNASPNLLSALAGTNMATRGERSDTILSYYGANFHDSQLRSGDTMVKFIQARVEGYLSGLNGDQPLAEFPYLSRFSDSDPVDVLYNYLKNEYLVMPLKERLKPPAEVASTHLKKGEKRSVHLEKLMKLYHAAFSRRGTGTKQRGPWGNREHRSGAVAETRCIRGCYTKGEVDKTKWAVLLWDTLEKRPCLALAVPRTASKSGEPAPAENICFQNLVQLDGSSLPAPVRDGFSIGKDGMGKGLLLPVKFGHDFRRWWKANISNDDPQAPAYKRAVMKSFKMVIVDPDDTPNRPARVYIQPSFSFGEGSRKPDRKMLGKAGSSIQFLVGLDWGITFPIYAAVLDVKSETVLHAESVDGQSKIEHSKLAIRAIADANAALAVVLRQRAPAGADPKRWRRSHEKRVEKARQMVRQARRALRSVSAFDVVEATARLVAWIDGDPQITKACLRSGSPGEHGKLDDYLFVIENLKRPVVNDLKRVQSLLRTREALKHQLRRRGFPARQKHPRRFPYGLEEVNAAGTSKLGLSGWIRTDAPRLNESLPFGREVGKYIARGLTAGQHLRGSRKSIGPGKNVFKANGQSDEDRTRHKDFGQQLFWDPNLTSWNGRSSDNGWVLPADFVAAVNIAVRLWAVETVGKQKKPGKDDEFEKAVLEQHKQILSRLSYSCDVPAWLPIVENNKLVALRPAEVV